MHGRLKPSFWINAIAMAGRYALVSSAKTIEGTFNASFDHAYAPVPNAYPSLRLPVISNIQPNTITLYTWGLIPYWSRTPDIAHYTFNARAEKIFSRPSFKVPIKLRRCLVPANAFYEWRESPAEKAPFLIYCQDQPLFAFAGIFDSWADPRTDKIIHSFSIITVPSNPRMSFINERMPVILKPRQYEKWLNKKTSTTSIKSMLHAYENRHSNAYPVSTGINDPHHKELSLLQPIGDKLYEDRLKIDQFLA